MKPLIGATFIVNTHLIFIASFLFSQSTIVSSTVNGVASGGAPTMYRPNFSQAFQRAGPTTVPPTLSAGLYPTQSFTSSLLSNGIQSNTGCWCYIFSFYFTIFYNYLFISKFRIFYPRLIATLMIQINFRDCLQYFVFLLREQ